MVLKCSTKPDPFAHMEMINKNMLFRILAVFAILLLNETAVVGQNKGLKTITDQELRYQLGFLGAPEFRGRMTPSPELEIATVYLGNWAKSSGLTPILPDGSFYQSIPMRVTSVSAPNTRLRVFTEQGEQVFYYQKSFGGNYSTSGSYSGEVVFVGLGISNPDLGWTTLKISIWPTRWLSCSTNPCPDKNQI